MKPYGSSLAGGGGGYDGGGRGRPASWVAFAAARSSGVRISRRSSRLNAGAVAIG